MIPVKQTIFTTETQLGNCLSACLASLLDVPIDRVPALNIHEYQFYQLASFMQALGYWVGGRKAPQFIPKDFYGIDGYFLASGPSPRKGTHFVIYDREGNMAHDPHPDNTGILQVYDYCIISRPEHAYEKSPFVYPPSFKPMDWFPFMDLAIK